MFRSRLLKAAASTALIATMAAPAPAWSSRAVPGDGEPTDEACRELGFANYGGEYDGRGMVRARPQAYAGQPPVMIAPPPPPPPPSPPPPPPPVSMSGSTADAFVGGQRAAREAMPASPGVSGYYGPTIPYGPPAGTVETERYPDASVNPVKRVAEHPTSTFSIDVDTASYSNVRRFLNEGRLPPRDAVRVEELVNYFDYDYPLPQSRAEPFRPFVAVTPSPWNEGKRIVHIGLQGYDIPTTQRPPLNLVFLVDVSGSMLGEDRLTLAQR